MTLALTEMRKRLDNAALLVDVDKKEAFERHRKSILDAAEVAIDAQRKREAAPIKILGERYVRPAPVEPPNEGKPPAKAKESLTVEDEQRKLDRENLERLKQREAQKQTERRRRRE